MEIVIGLVILYVIQAVLIYGMTFGHFESDYPDSGNEGFAIFMALFAGILPIIGPVTILCLSGFARRGLRWK